MKPRCALASAAATAVLGVGLCAVPASGAQGVTLRSPDGAAACSLAAARLTCSNRDYQQRQPPVALSLGARGEPVAVRSSISWNERTPVVRSGAPQSVGRFSCRLASGGLLCANSAGAAVAVSADRIFVLLAPAVKG